MKSYLRRLVMMGLTSLAYLSFICVRPAAAQVIWSRQLNLNSQADIPNALETPLSEMPDGIVYTNGTVSRTIKTCKDYLDSVSAGFHPQDNLGEKRATSFVFQCYVLRDLQHARPATSGSAYHWTVDSLSQLPPILVVGSKELEEAAEKAEQNGTNWKQYNSDLKIISIKNDQMQAEDEDTYYTLTIVARGDFNGDGIEDIAVVGVSMGKQTTWADSQYFIFAANGAKLVRLTSNNIPYLLNVQIPN